MLGRGIKRNQYRILGNVSEDLELGIFGCDRRYPKPTRVLPSIYIVYIQHHQNPRFVHKPDDSCGQLEQSSTVPNYP